MTEAAPAGPVTQRERIEVLDVLRGAAIFGILIGNMVVVSGYWFLPEPGRAVLPTAAIDGVVTFLLQALVEAKFYSIFSLLFGIGFAVQLGRAGGAEGEGGAFVPRFRRRLRGLLLIGLLHAVFIWSGDILMLYALLGFLLVPFRAAADRTLLRGALLCLALPVPVYALMLAAGAGQGMEAALGTGNELPEFLVMITDGLRGGDWLATFRANLMMLAGRWFDLFLSARFPKVFGMFLLGFLIGRSGVGLDAERHRPLLRRVAVLGFAVGVPANLVMSWLESQRVFFPASWPGLAQVVVASLGVPLLALAYVATIVLAFHSTTGRRLLAPLAWPGRMALTNYLMHSVVMVLLFYGIGLGWYWQVGPTATTLLALLVCLLQVPLSRAWLSRYRFGPVEWLWRRFTYRQPIPLRRPAAA